MGRILDEEGNLFGVVNVIDALVVLVVVAVGVAGVALVAGGGASGTGSGPSEGNATENGTVEKTTVVVEHRSEKLQPYVAAAIPEGPVPGDNVTRIREKSVAPTEVVVQSQSGTLSVQRHPRLETVTLRVGLNVTERERDGEYVFRGKALEVGRKLTLDVGPTTVSGHVVQVEPGDG